MFCRNCGNELHDEAYVCVKCGQLVQDYQKSKKEKEQNPYSMISVCGAPLSVFFLIAFATGCLTLILAIIAVAFAQVRAPYYDASWYYFTPFVGCAIASSISSLVCMGMGTTQFILGFKKGGVIKLLVIANFIFSLAMAILGVAMLACIDT